MPEAHNKGPVTALHTRSARASGEGERQIVVFTLGSESFGADIVTIREIIIMQAVTALPGMPAFAEGVINLRGQVVPVIDLKRRLGLREGARGSDTRIMVAETDSGLVGCVVDSVNEVLTVSAAAIEPPPEGVSVQVEGVEGVAKVGERLVILVNLPAILRTQHPT